MKRLPLLFVLILSLTFSIFIISKDANSQALPDILYYKFENNAGPTSTPNSANPGAGNNPATITGSTVLASGGQFDSCISGNAATNGGVQTGWNTNLGSSSWTISMWIELPTNATGSALYLFGDNTAGSFRCFHNGAAGVNSLRLTGTGITNVNVTGVGPAPMVVTFVYDSALASITVYKNGVFDQTVVQTPLNLTTGTGGFKIGGYTTSATMSAKLDEFRVYRRALSAAEVLATWNVELGGGGGPVVQPDSICYKGPVPAYPTGFFGHASNWLGDTLYICGGSATGTASTSVYRYSMNSDSWSAGTSMPVAKTGGDLVQCGNALYYIGGGSALAATGGTSTTLRYRPNIGWDTVASIPQLVAGNTAEAWGDSVIFCIAGGWTQYYRTIQVYRVGSNTWSKADSLGAGLGRRSHATGIVGNKIFVSCGFSGAFRNDTQIGTIGANANSITWSTAPAINCRSGMSRPGGVGHEGYFYVIGAETSPAPAIQDSVFRFNVNTNTWETPIRGRGTGAASNYWGVVSAKTIDNRVNIFIPGGSVTGATTWGLYIVRSGGCSLVTGIENTGTGIPDNFKLSQNYPNPFNPTTKIAFSIPVRELVVLKLYDITGKEVSTLANRTYEAGNYILDFNAGSLSSGIYFYTITAGSFRDTKKMMLIK